MAIDTDIRAMNLKDVPLGQRLKDAAGWNQIPSDWQRLLVFDPASCFVAEWDKQPVALDPSSGYILLDAAFSDHQGQTVFLDVPLPNRLAMQWAVARGLRIHRQFLRMVRGHPAADRLLLTRKIWLLGTRTAMSSRGGFIAQPRLSYITTRL